MNPQKGETPSPQTAPAPRPVSDTVGYDSWSFGASGGIWQPPYVVRFRGRWWRTKPLTAEKREDHLSPGEVSALRRMPHLSYGASRCSDHLHRTGKTFSELPLFEPLRYVPQEPAGPPRSDTAPCIPNRVGWWYKLAPVCRAWKDDLLVGRIWATQKIRGEFRLYYWSGSYSPCPMNAEWLGDGWTGPFPSEADARAHARSATS